MDNSVCEVKKHLFTLGKVVMTNGIRTLISNEGIETVLKPLIEKHVTGEFGDLCESDIDCNIEAIKEKSMILSAYTIKEMKDLKIYIITDPGHETTTVLLPSEY